MFKRLFLLINLILILVFLTFTELKQNIKTFININDFIQNNHHDYTKEIQDVLSNGNNSVIFFPPIEGVYRITDTLILPKNVTIFLGDSITYEGEVAKNLFRAKEFENIKIISINNASIDGGNVNSTLKPSDGTKSNSGGVYLSNSYKKGSISIEGVKIENTFGPALVIDNANSIKINSYTAKDIGRGNINTKYAGESLVIKNSNNVNVNGFTAINTTDGMGILLSENVKLFNLIFINCAIGPSISASQNVLIDNVNIVNPLIRGIDSVSWSNLSDDLNYGSKNLIIRSAVIESNAIEVDGNMYRGNGIAIDSTDNASIDAEINGAKNALTINRNYLSNKILPEKNGSITINLKINDYRETGVILSAVEKITGKIEFNNNNNLTHLNENDINFFVSNNENSINDIKMKIKKNKDIFNIINFFEKGK
ncbi:hypothetical protein [Bacillus sp. T2.9-1]|uniref:hypothetical protein n=1 Tax=Bacillus sp. T2.9-1 TaxID=3041163 RepID=UPI00253FD0CE|nr:hypothetical protein [Bacillus sp. T2.9-1]